MRQKCPSIKTKWVPLLEPVFRLFCTSPKWQIRRREKFDCCAENGPKCLCHLCAVPKGVCLRLTLLWFPLHPGPRWLTLTQRQRNMLREPWLRFWQLAQKVLTGHDPSENMLMMASSPGRNSQALARHREILSGRVKVFKFWGPSSVCDVQCRQCFIVY